MKICVYAICKNEEKFINRWVNSMKEADDIYVLDTGSTDNSVNLLKELGVHVKISRIEPWRFDTARNEALKLLPKDTDLCVCTDIDEIFLPGWRKILENNFDKGYTRCKYTYNWSLDENERPIVSFYLDKIHILSDYKWINPVHEILFTNKKENIITINNIIVNHYPDDKKSRSDYLPLLELSVEEDPTNDRNMHYLGREYMYYGRWNDSIDTLIKHLNLPTAIWKDERCASMRFIGRCYQKLNRNEEAKMWLDKAINEAPYLRDPYMEMAILGYKLNNWQLVIDNCQSALKIKNNNKTYINETFCWDNTPYDLLSIAYFYLNNYDKAIFYINKALKIKSSDRLLNNKKIINEALKN